MDVMNVYILKKKTGSSI